MRELIHATAGSIRRSIGRTRRRSNIGPEAKNFSFGLSKTVSRYAKASGRSWSRSASFVDFLRNNQMGEIDWSNLDLFHGSSELFASSVGTPKLYSPSMRGVNRMNASTTYLSNKAHMSAQQLPGLINQLGLTKTWYSLMLHKVESSTSPDKSSMSKLLTNRGGARTRVPNLLEGLSYQEISILYEYSLAHDSHDARKESGQFFTPNDVAQLMAEKAKKIDDGQPWIDPCCGLGVLTYWLAKTQVNPAVFLKSRMWLVDKDPTALLLAAIMLTIELGSDIIGVFQSLKSRSKSSNFLNSNITEAKNAILNPPYVLVSPDERFESSTSRDMYAYFIEKVLTHSRGIVAITPQSFTNGQKFRGLRNLLIDKLRTADIYCFDNVPDNIFRGVKFGSQNSNRVNSTRAAIIVATTDGIFLNSNHVGKRRFRITPLLRWRANERSLLFHQVDNYLSEFIPSKEIFPKVSSKQKNLLTKLKSQTATIADLVVKTPTRFSLHVPSTPRYFITASKRTLARSSVKHLYFKNSHDRDLAYVILNSDLAYWWWRVFDGGMSLSEKTLMSTPVPSGFSGSPKLVKLLESSEKKNLVTKLNAGMTAENIKHSNKLINLLTEEILGADAVALHCVRNNSIFLND